MNFNVTNLPNEYAQLVASLTAVSYLLWILIHIIFAVAVYSDAKKSETRLVGPFLWALVTLFGGVLFAGVYWVVNRLAIGQDLAEMRIADINPSYGDSVEDKLSKFKSSFNK
ncbi:MAG: hypothetical protein OQJ89_09265 [Kangiellaceae bacterium]|nr:hypothetical protein [Kangiellaceae bacterium]MCW9000570.1 hypothetical protein [Kangiellaceae bacterium]MCW9017141.1 hypothetical protein [Kangiellaceae bacterium]